MHYSIENLSVVDFFVVPKFFFIPAIVEKRKPLSDKARRAGWTGCNILLSQIPEQGKIYYVREEKEIEKSFVLSQMAASVRLQTENLDSRSWVMDVLNCVNALPNNCFSLSDVYYFEDSLKKKHPDNHNIRAKIRQQLQVLRDKHFIEFLGNGQYRKILL